MGASAQRNRPPRFDFNLWRPHFIPAERKTRHFMGHPVAVEGLTVDEAFRPIEERLRFANAGGLWRVLLPV